MSPSNPSHGSSVPDVGKASLTAALPGETCSFEDNVAGHLAAMGATHIDSLCRVFGKDASEISRTLVVLELKGVVRRLPGGYYLTA